MKEKLLVDLFNVIHRLRLPSVQKAVFELESFAAQKGKKVTVVLDGQRYEGEFPESPWFEVLCSRSGEPADEVMEVFMQEIPQPERLDWVLVSEDRALRSMAQGMGLRVQSPQELFSDMRDSNAQESRKQPGKSRPFNNPFTKL